VEGGRVEVVGFTENLGHRVGGVLLAGFNDPGRPALDPADGLLAALHVTVVVDHPATLVADQSDDDRRTGCRPPAARDSRSSAAPARIR
jgi:hypothetical protein